MSELTGTMEIPETVADTLTIVKSVIQEASGAPGAV